MSWPEGAWMGGKWLAGQQGGLEPRPYGVRPYTVDRAKQLVIPV